MELLWLKYDFRVIYDMFFGKYLCLFDIYCFRSFIIRFIRKERVLNMKERNLEIFYDIVVVCLSRIGKVICFY